MKRMNSRQLAAVRRSRMLRAATREGQDHVREAERLATLFGFRDGEEVVIRESESLVILVEVPS